MRVFGLVLFLLSVVTVSSGQPELSYFDIVNHFWRYYDDSGLLGLIVFNADFTIGMYTGGQEAQWGFGD